MKYFLGKPEIDNQISEIKRKIRLSMNGVVADQMTGMGIVYKKNFGVAVPRLREIATQYAPNHDLAQRLWALGMRETMILATMLQPIEKFTENLAVEWSKEFNQIEIIEHACQNLFSKLDYAGNLSLRWVFSDDEWLQIAGFILAARIYNQLSPDNVEVLFQQALVLSDKENGHLTKSIALCLSRLCRRDKNLALQIYGMINSFQQKGTAAQQFIYSEVEQEINFLGLV